MTKLEELGLLIKNQRESNGESQEKFGQKLGSNRTAIAHLEQGRKLPELGLFITICETLKIPKNKWELFINQETFKRIEFETILSELVGKSVSLDLLSPIEQEEAKKHIDQLFESQGDENQMFDYLNRCLIFYGIKKVSKPFFHEFLSDDTFNSINTFKSSIQKYQEKVIRVFSTYALAYEELNKNEIIFNNFIKHLSPHDLTLYTRRNSWQSIVEIKNEDLKFLGYIAAEEVKKEEVERKSLTDFLDDVIKKCNHGGILDILILSKEYNVKTLNKMDTLLRKFNSKLVHGLFSSLFQVDIDLIVREKERLAPKDDNEIVKMKQIQDQAFANLSNYLTADYMDLYIATSMRSDGDFISVNQFVNNLIHHEDIRKLNLRYFNPTQSWIEDRVAKGLVEALMLKRANITIYMAQKSDTFGKDSEASVSLGQGKPVIVYVPKLVIEEVLLDTEELSKLDKSSLQKKLLESETEDYDDQALLAAVLKQYLDQVSDSTLIATSKKYWAEFDFENETDRIKTIEEKKEFRDFIENIKLGNDIDEITGTLKINLKDILTAVTISYEKRARIFKEIHPLALQVILSSGVLNGIIVTRSLNSCANLLKNLLLNTLDLKLEIDENNYKLIEKTTGSVIRVISKNILLSYAFEQFYMYKESTNC